jgi:hypothetical protein
MSVGYQSEAAVDIATEDVEEAVDNGDVVSHVASDLISKVSSASWVAD